MHRRKFILNSTLALSSLSIFPILSGCKSGGDEKKVQAGGESGTGFRWDEATVASLQKSMESGELTAVELTRAYLKRIDEIDRNGPALKAVIEINPDAIAIATQLDEERKNKKLRGPLHGIPVLIKDNIDTADKMMTTAGSLAMEGNIAQRDAFIVQQLRAAGAVLLGKTNLSEWANFRSTRSSSGWSSRGGQTRNPYILDRSPCGSSSGSGTAVAANLCTLAIGTETNGSIACPASVNGVVGIKPTVGLWSRSGIIPISHTQDTAGPMARTVSDAAVLLGALSAMDSADTVVIERKQKAAFNYSSFLKADALTGARIGVEKSFLKGHEGIDALLREALDTMKAKGAEIVEVDLFSRLEEVSKFEYDLLKYEFKDGLNRYLASAGGKVKSLDSLIGYNSRNSDRVMPYFRQEILEASQEMGDLSDKDYQEKMKQLVTTTRNEIDKLLEENRLAGICGPATGPSWCIDPINGDSFTGYGMYSPAAIAGYPSVTVPMGVVNGLPAGLSFIGTAWAEGVLISVAYSYEQASGKRTVPGFRTSINS